MKTDLKAGLTKAISDWADSVAEHPSWPDAWVHDNLSDHMANAAEAVFDATVEASKAGEANA